MTLFYKEMKSPVGKLKLVASSKALVAGLAGGLSNEQDSFPTRLNYVFPD